MPKSKRGYSLKVRRLRKYNRRTANRLLGAKGLRALTHTPVYFSSTFWESTISGAGAGTSGNFAYSATLSDLPNYTEFQALFDQYKILKLVYRIEPNFTGNDSASGTGAATPANQYNNGYIRVVKDYDDATPLSAESDYFQYDNMLSKPSMGKAFTVTVYPKMKLTTGGNTDVSVSPRWIDLDNVNVPHYGIKIFSPVTNLPAPYYEMKIYCTVYFVCKNRK